MRAACPVILAIEGERDLYNEASSDGGVLEKEEEQRFLLAFSTLHSSCGNRNLYRSEDEWGLNFSRQQVFTTLIRCTG